MNAEAENAHSRLALAVARHLGMHFPDSRARELVAGVDRAAAELGVDRTSAIEWLEQPALSARELEALANQLTVGETYFFRDQALFRALEDQVFPELIRACAAGTRGLRIWSAGCCTGEEPYSVAMLLERFSELSPHQVSILATDLNPSFLRKAETGVYNRWSFRGTDPGLQRRFFSELPNGCHEIAPRMRERIRFARLNLARDAFPTLVNDVREFDLILCRNVLMYFTEESVREILERFRRCLRPGGWLALSPTDPQRGLLDGFTAVHYDGAMLYRLDNDAPVARATVLLPVPDAVPAPRQDQHQTSRDRRGPAPRVSRPAASSAAEAKETTTLERARHAANAGRLVQALELCERAIEVHKLDPSAYHLKASVLAELGRGDEVGAALNQALYLDPGFIPAHFAAAHQALRRREPARARRHLTAVLELLRGRPSEDVVPELDGLTVGRIAELSRALVAQLD